MATGHLDLLALVRRLADMTPARTEANVQRDLQAMLLAAPLQLGEGDLEDIVLEQPAGGRRRIDVEAGLCVFEVKRDLRRGNVRADAIDQLAGYVTARTEEMAQRYVGVLTDGAEWQLFHLSGEALQLVSSFNLEPARPDVDGLCVWLEAVLATDQQIAPTPHEIERRLGANSPSYLLDSTEIRALYQRGRQLPGIRLKRDLWARLLTTAFGTSFADSEELFVNHTLLVITAEIIAHSVMGLDPTAQDVAPAALLSGHLFNQAQVSGVIDADFFDWVLEVEGGETFVRTLARRINRFAWQNVDHDVLKVLYESVISAEQRKDLGEYYTPDWLAQQVVENALTEPLTQRMLDPACGSGTFLFHAIRRYFQAADDAGLPSAQALTGVSANVIGMDIHPVAVTFARVTYLLAIGSARLQAADRPPISVPVYLGDSIQWGQERTLFNDDAIVIPTTGAGQLWATELRFPSSVVRDAQRFDRLVSEMADLAAGARVRGAPAASPLPMFRRYAVTPSDQTVLTATYETMCRLHDSGENHIWGYYARNLARPFWLSIPQNRVNVLVGNPPWLSYRFMTAEMQRQFRALSEERGLWAGASVATNQDLSSLFVLRTIERYLPVGGRFAFVLPWATLRGRQYVGFRRGHYELPDQVPVSIRFGTPWDLHAVKPAFFPVPASVVLGERAEPHAGVALPEDVTAWSGRLPRANLAWDAAAPFVERTAGQVRRAGSAPAGDRSPYHERFSQGASVVPRVLFVVEERPAGPMGSGLGRVPVRSRRSATEKKPWKDLPALEGSVDRQFVGRMHVGDTILPYRTLTPRRVVIPWDGNQLLVSDEQRAYFPGLADWWTRVDALWMANRASEKLTLLGQLDYQSKLSNQLPVVQGTLRLVYTKGGMYMAAAVVRDDSIIDHKLYWGTVSSLEEGRYLEAVLNSDFLTARIRPLQARGQHNPRDFDKYVWRLRIPLYEPGNPLHARLSQLGHHAAVIAAAVELPAGRRFETLRRIVRDAIRASAVGTEIEELVSQMLLAE